jgi:hypothetical protein
MIKIFTELGGKSLAMNPSIELGGITNFAGPAGLNNLREMLTGNVTGTLKQMDALAEHLKQMLAMGQIDKSQLNSILKIIAEGRKRLEVQADFIKSSVSVKSNASSLSHIEMNFTDANGNPVRVTLTNGTPADIAVSDLNKLMLAEEKANGDPMRDLGKSMTRSMAAESRAIGLGASATSLAAAPTYCQGKILDSPISATIISPATGSPHRAGH